MIGAGPPCDTFSAARYLPGGPKPLRNAEQPWGKFGLLLGDYQHLHVANTLLRAALGIAYVVGQTGGSGFIEHSVIRTG